MEQQDNPSSTSSFTEDVPSSHPQHYPHYHRDTSGPSASLPAPTSPPHPQADDSLSTSEPSLRFPRLAESRQLANWISTSDPNIMRVSSRPTEDSGLSESTYELISGVDDNESWSQDGNDHDYISESVSSLEPRRPDDVQSLADTEQMTDDDFTPAPARPSSNNTPPYVSRNPSPGPKASNDDYESDYEVDEAAASRSSLEYTQQSLGTPSMNTPEASRVYEQLPVMHPALGWIKEIYNTLRARPKAHFESLRRGLEDGTVAVTNPTIVIMVVFQLIAFGLATYAAVGIMANIRTSGHNNQVPPLAAVTTTASTAPELHTSTTSTSPVRSLAASNYSTALTLREDEPSIEWLFGPKKPEISFSTQANNALLAQIPEGVKTTWMCNDCVSLTAARDGKPVGIAVVSVQEGLIAKFPRREVHGVVDLTLESTCKPVLKKVVKVRFVNGIWEDVLELTKHVTKDLMPVAERGLDEFKKVMEPARNSLRKYSLCLHQLPNADELVVMKNEISDLIRTRYDNFRSKFFHSCGRHFNDVQRHGADLVHDAQTRLQLRLLHAQISAKLSWLSILGKKEEHEEYQHKATVFMKKKEAAANKLLSRGAGNAGRLWWS